MPTEITVVPTQVQMGKRPGQEPGQDMIAVHFIDDQTSIIYTVLIPSNMVDEFTKSLQATKTGVELPTKPQITVARAA